MTDEKKKIQKNIKQRKFPEYNSQRPFRYLLIEIFSIVLGVLLALGVNEWRENHSHRMQAETALINVANEIQSNIKLLDILHKNNSMTVKKMVEETNDKSDKKSKFIPGLQLRETAWQTLLSTGISNYIDYETLLLLSEVYSLQKVYKQSGKMLTEAAMNMSAFAVVMNKEFEEYYFKKQFIDYMELLVKVEEELMNSFQSVKDHLKQNKHMST